MESKITFIDIDLGIDLDRIILDSAQRLSDDAQRELDGALAVSIEAKKIKDRKMEEKNSKTSIQEKILNEILDKLEYCLESGVTADEINGMLKGHIANLGAFTTRMKFLLIRKGSPYKLIKYQQDKVTRYKLEPFNQK